jgi:hypothetical protein
MDMPAAYYALLDIEKRPVIARNAVTK